MPAFTFEKIEPPAPQKASARPRPSAISKPVGTRSLVGHMLDRLTVTRLKREQNRKNSLRKKD